MPTWHFARPSIPIGALVASFSALAVPVGAELFAADFVGEYEVMLWLLALVPAFLLAYYRGWAGAATALAAGMAALSLTQVVLVAFGAGIGNWPLLLCVVVAYAAISLGIGLVSELLHAERARAELMALTDDLTGLANRRCAHVFLEREFAAAERGRPLVLVFFDFDRFKEYNDRHGHAAGDAALEGFGSLLEDETRKMNLSARYGGEEFLSILSSCTVEGALTFVDRVRTALTRTAFDGEAVTVSVGVAAYRPGLAEAADLLDAADQALYRAKQSGRNAVQVHRPSAELAAR